MCGIVGMVNLNQDSISPFVIKKMTDILSHRGPDGEGQWIENNVGLGHRRLSIIDLSEAAKQPMTSMDKRWVLTYNGEIYNFKELRSELETNGFYFKSNSDSEVVLNALSHWGVEALKKFNGMFALALFDRQQKTLLLARDRYGIKPLYFSKQNNFFAFSSEHKAILEIPSFQKRINKRAIFEYFTFQNIFTNQTFLKDINLLPSGHFGIINLSKNQSSNLELHQYWDYEFSNQGKVSSDKEYIEELDRLFVQAVERQLVGDVDVGTYLSGGMDSGSIVAIASNKIKNLNSFTCGFDVSSASGIELGFDEREKAEAMSAIFKTEHYEMVLKAGDIERCIDKLVWHLEEPRVGQSYPNFYAAKLASKFVKVVLSGTGGDELFGGYPWRYYRAAVCQNFDEYIDKYYLYWQRLLNNNTLKTIFKPVWTDVQDVWTRNIFKNVFNNHKNKLETPEDFINHSLYFECKTFLHGLFVVEDKLSMAHSLENRVPFMDNDLVDFAMKCPVSSKLNKLQNVMQINENQQGSKKNTYFQKTNDGKKILRKMISKYIPQEIVSAPKKGFSSPDASWFKGESMNFINRILIESDSPIYEILDRKTTISLLEDHFQGKQNRRLFIWSLLNLDIWFKKYII